MNRRVIYHDQWCRCGKCVVDPIDEIVHEMKSLRNHLRVWNDAGGIYALIDASLAHFIRKYESDN